MTNEKILPCPRCGRVTANMNCNKINGATLHYVVCGNGACQYMGAMSNTIKTSISIWNSESKKNNTAEKLQVELLKHLSIISADNLLGVLHDLYDSLEDGDITTARNLTNEAVKYVSAAIEIANEETQ